MNTAPTEIYTLSLHDALPISPCCMSTVTLSQPHCAITSAENPEGIASQPLTQALPAASRALSLLDRSEEHTSELQSHVNLVCRLLLEKKKNLLQLAR